MILTSVKNLEANLNKEAANKAFSEAPVQQRIEMTLFRFDNVDFKWKWNFYPDVNRDTNQQLKEKKAELLSRGIKLDRYQTHYEE